MLTWVNAAPFRWQIRQSSDALSVTLHETALAFGMPLSQMDELMHGINGHLAPRISQSSARFYATMTAARLQEHLQREVCAEDASGWIRYMYRTGVSRDVLAHRLILTLDETQALIDRRVMTCSRHLEIRAELLRREHFDRCGRAA